MILTLSDGTGYRLLLIESRGEKQRLLWEVAIL